jgi:hypothetical protein
MKIQQMAFMIVAVFFFFILVGLFFLGWQYKSLRGSYESLEAEQAISAMNSIIDLTELNCEADRSLCLDEDKLQVMVRKQSYSEIWPVASIKVYKVYPKFDSVVKCPSSDCNYYEIYDSGQENLKSVSTYVSLCKKKSEQGYVYDDCEIAKIVVGQEMIE